jgi:hypothetical protein|tara:strand:- start:2385 stop:3062 length:678 start_codon:yes stop_codon:yes gene_type:complete
MNLSEMMTVVRDQAQTDTADAPDGLLTFYARSAYQDIQSRVGQWPHLRESFVKTTVAGTPNYAFATFAPNTMEYIVSATVPDHVLYPMSRDEYRAVTRNSTTTGAPTHYMVDGDVVWLWPTPAAAVALSLSGYASFTDWPSGVDEPNLPRGFDSAIVFFMMARYYQSQEDIELYQQYMRDYEATLQNQIERAMRGTDIFMGPSIKGSGRSAGISETQWMRRNVEG